MEIEIRELKNKDVWEFANILLSVADNSDEKIIELISDISQNDKENKEMEMGIEIMIFVLKSAFKNARSELQDWFADLCEMETEEFLEEAGPTATLEVIEQLKEQEQIEDFFSKASALFSNMKE